MFHRVSYIVSLDRTLTLPLAQLVPRATEHSGWNPWRLCDSLDSLREALGAQMCRRAEVWTCNRRAHSVLNAQLLDQDPWLQNRHQVLPPRGQWYGACHRGAPKMWLPKQWDALRARVVVVNYCVGSLRSDDYRLGGCGPKPNHSGQENCLVGYAMAGQFWQAAWCR